MASSSIKKYYAVARGRQTGVFTDWVTCSSLVTGYPKASYKMFVNEYEAHVFAGTAKSVPLPEPSKSSQTKKRASSTPLDELEDTATTTRRSTNRAEMTKEEIRARAEKEGRPPLDPNTQVIYTDGACSSNGFAGAKAGVGVYFGKDDPRNISEPLPGELQTNIRAELLAAIRALQIFTDMTRPVEIRSDCTYVVDAANVWMDGWFKSGVMPARIKNPDLFIILRELCMARKAAGAVTIFTHVHAHSGLEGNEAADRLAVAGRRQMALPLPTLIVSSEKEIKQ